MESGEIEIRHVPTNHQVADILTNGLSRDWFMFLCGKLGIKLSLVHVSSNDSTGIPKIKHFFSPESSLRGNVEACSV